MSKFEGHEAKIFEIFKRYADMNAEGDMMMPFKQNEYEGFIMEVASYVEIIVDRMRRESFKKVSAVLRSCHESQS